MFAASSRLPVSVSMIVPFSRFGESAEEVLVTTIVHVETPPTWIRVRRAALRDTNRRLEQVGAVTPPMRWPVRTPAVYVAVTVFTSGSGSPANTVGEETRGPHRKRPARAWRPNEAVSYRGEGNRKRSALVTVIRPVLHTSMV